MTFVLAGLVSRNHALDSASRADELIRLSQGLVLMPTSARPLMDGLEVEPWVLDLAMTASRAARVAYLEAEFSGGTGAQAAIGYEHGSVGLGPLLTQSVGEGLSGFVEVPPRKADDWAINRALAWLGVDPGDEIDAFSAAGFGSRRDWSLPRS
jgi:hypothetical protein